MIARAIVYRDTSPTSSRFFAFNASTLAAFLFVLVLELVEDVLTHAELLPQPPVNEEDLEHYSDLDGDSLKQIFAKMDLPRKRFSTAKSWNLDGLACDGAKAVSDFDRLANAGPGAETVSICSCAGGLTFAANTRHSWRDNLRLRMGQQRRVQHASSLHGLRPLTFFDHLGILCIFLGMAICFSDLMVGPGYLRGVCPEPSPVFSAL